MAKNAKSKASGGGSELDEIRAQCEKLVGALKKGETLTGPARDEYEALQARARELLAAEKTPETVPEPAPAAAAESDQE